MAALTLTLAPLALAAPPPDQKTTTLPAKKFPPGPKPIDPANMDPSVKPGTDFYRYANGKWLDKNPVPASESRWGAFSELAERNSQILYDILEESAKKGDAPKGSPQQMVGDFYASFGFRQGRRSAPPGQGDGRLAGSRRPTTLWPRWRLRARAFRSASSPPRTPSRAPK